MTKPLLFKKIGALFCCSLLFILGLTAQPSDIDIGGFCGTTELYDGQVFGKPSPFSPNQLKSPGTWSVGDGYGDGCGTDCNVAPFDNAPPQSGCNPGTFSGQAVYRIPVVVTVIEDCAGGNPDSITQQMIDNSLDIINEFYQTCQGIPLELTKCTSYPGAPTNGDNSTRTVIDPTLCEFSGGTGAGTDNAYASSVDVPNVLNLYIADVVNGGDGCNGFAFLPNNPGNGPDRAVMESSCFASALADTQSPNYDVCTSPRFAQVIIHEIGHYFGLYHTHEPIDNPSDLASGNECPDGSNCCTAGDFICDTDADPGYSHAINNGCGTRNGCDVDVSGCVSGCGDNYSAFPNTMNNIMSYNTLVGCINTYSDCQKAKIVDALTCARYNLCCPDPEFYLANVTDTDHTLCVDDPLSSIQGVSGMCYNWYVGAEDGATLIAGNTDMLTAAQVASVVDVTQPGTYAIYAEDVNSFQSPPCRLEIEYTILADVGTPTASSIAAIESCDATTLTVSTNSLGLEDSEIIGWWFTADNPISNSITDQASLDAAIAGATIGGTDASDNTIYPSSTPPEELSLMVDCSALDNGTTYYLTPFIANDDVPPPDSFTGSAVGDPSETLVPVDVSQLPTGATLEQVCVELIYTGPFATYFDLGISLQAPDGTTLLLENAFPNFENTPSTFNACFVDDGTGHDGGTGCNAACYTGNLESNSSFTPYDLSNPNGTWTLIVTDDQNPTYFPGEVNIELIFDMAPVALMFPDATYTDCIFGQAIEFTCDCTACNLEACTDPAACNYNPAADCDDGSCILETACDTDACINGGTYIWDTNTCACILDNATVEGCTDNTACNFDVTANCDDGSCILQTACDADPCTNGGIFTWNSTNCACELTTATVEGCTDNTACNFDAAANCDDNSCILQTACDADPCTNGGIFTWNSTNCACELTTATVEGCTDNTACNFDATANCDDNTCIFETTCDMDPCTNGGTYIWDTNTCACVLDNATVEGCTDNTACNFDATANCEDNTCIFETTCDIDPCTNGGIFTWDATNCACELTTATIEGCTDNTACNFETTANCDDNSCIFETTCDMDPCTNGGTYIWNDTNCDCVLDEATVSGCTDATACNYNATANCDDNSCILQTACDVDPCTNGGIYAWDTTTCDCLLDEATVSGCTTTTAANYDPNANCDDGSCECVPDGCADNTACNFDPTATCNDPDRCVYETTCDMDPCTNNGTYIWDATNCACVLDQVTVTGCIDATACNYNPNANCDNENVCIYETTCDMDACTNGGTYIWDAATCGCILDEPTVLGCADLTACNFDPNATCDEPTACIYETTCDMDACTNGGTYIWNATTCDCILDQATVTGCTDATACNYNATANCDDNSCIFQETCDMDPCTNGGLYVWNPAVCRCSLEEPTVEGCTDANACNYNATANCNDAASCIYEIECDLNPCTNGGIFSWNATNCACELVTATIEGCTDNTACNFDPNANCDDSSCILETTCDADPCTNGGAYIWDIAICDCSLDRPTAEGCMDNTACNFDPNANCNTPTTCVYETTCDADPCTNGGTYVWDAATCGCIIHVATIEGCTDNTACNFDATANCDDSSCILEITCDADPCTNGGSYIWDAATCGCIIDAATISGCTSSTAPNYNPNANCDDGSCECVPDGCTDNTACNFDVAATCDNGSCIYEITCDIDPCTNGGIFTWDATTCGCQLSIPTISGCTDNTACNFDATANCNDAASCVYETTCDADPCTNGGIFTWDATTCACELTTPTVDGCTDATACNFDATANCDDSSCIFETTCDMDACTNGGVFAWNAANCACELSIPTVTGCMDNTACNFNPNANCNDAATCIFETTCDVDPCTNGGIFAWDATTCSCLLSEATVSGCTTPSAANYDPTANCDDGSCECMPDGCTDNTACNFDVAATCDDGSCIYETACDADACTNGGIFTWDATTCDCVLTEVTMIGCTDNTACNFDANANCSDINACIYESSCDDDACTNGGIYTWDATTCSCSLTETTVAGCTDINACNYDANANCDNGSCDVGNTACTDPCNPVSGCTDNTACNYDANACVDDGSCLTAYGCTNPLACNYDNNATCDDGSCNLGNTTCSNPCNPISGCTDNTACNYDANACVDDGSCDAGNTACADPCNPISGCTDTDACNYDSNACVEDNACVYQTACDVDACTDGGIFAWDDTNCRCTLQTPTTNGCTDVTACNYDNNANCDDGSCDYSCLGCTDPCSPNYDSNASDDDGSCLAQLLGCTNPTACNYDDTALCDDGSCDLGDCCLECPDDIVTDCDSYTGAHVSWDAPTINPSCSIGSTDCGTAPYISGFIYAGTHNGSHYYCSTNNYTWTQANTICQANGGYLASINNASENSFIRNFIMTSNAWIGYHDTNSEGNFQWVSGEPTTYTNWQPGQPNNLYGTEHYTRIRKDSGQWTDKENNTYYECVMEVPCSSGSWQQISGPTSGSLFSQNTTTNIMYQYTDNDGNQYHCSFDVTVNACDFNCVECPDDVVLSCDAQSGGVILDLPQPDFDGSCLVEECEGEYISGFIYMGSYQGSKYYCSYYSDYTWEQANYYSQVYGGHLVTINNPGENAYVSSSIMTSKAWIGCHDKYTEGSFQWSNGEPMNYTNWYANQPNDYYGQDYCKIFKSNGQWADYDNHNKAEFVMEVPCDGGYWEQIAGPGDGTWLANGSNSNVTYEFTDSDGTKFLCSYNVSVEECDACDIVVDIDNEYNGYCPAYSVNTFTSNVYNGTGPYTYEWQISGSCNLNGTYTGGSTLSIYNYPGSATIHLIVTDANGCSGSQTYYIQGYSYGNNNGSSKDGISLDDDCMNKAFCVQNVYPTLTQNIVNINFTSKDSGDMYFQVHTPNGSVALEQRITARNGWNQKQLDLSNLPAGMYYISMYMNGEIQTTKIVKQ